LPDGRRVGAWGRCVTCPAVGGDCKNGGDRAAIFYYWDPVKEGPGFGNSNAEFVQLCGEGEGWWFWLKN